MANNDYWAYLRNENELKHGRKAISEGGSPNGYSSNPNYKPVGQKAKGVRDRFGNYIYDAARNISSRISKRFGDLSEAIRRKQIIDRNSKMEAQRTSYADMGYGKYGQNLKDPRFHSASGSKGLLAQKRLEEDAEAASQKRKAALEEEYRNNHRDAQTERPQDAMKKGQEERRAHVAKGVAALKAVWQDRDKYQKAFDAEGTEHDKPQYDMFRRKLEALQKKYGNDSAVKREIEKWQDELEEERKRRMG